LCVANVTVNGAVVSGSHVSPGASFSVHFDYTAIGTGSYCPGCIVQYFIGLSPEALTATASGVNASCFLNTIFGGSSQTSSATVTLNAPSTSGMYYLAIAGPGLSFSCPTASPLGTPTAAQYVGVIAVY
jgi:hypothetical protein